MKDAAASPAKTQSAQRRRPAQSRARATADAVREAFVQLLVEKGYEKVSIRQVIGLAGVSIGSFYEYFSSKEALASVCIHLRIKAVAAAMRASLAASRTEPLPARVDALIDAQSAPSLAEPEQWAALFLVERKVSGIEAFRSMYGEFVQLWVDMLSTSADWPAEVSASEAAFAAHAMTYSLVSQALLMSPSTVDAGALRRQVGTAVHGYLSVLAPRAYRLYRFDLG